MNGHYPLLLRGLVVSQPFGDFFVAPISARILLDVAYSDRLTAERRPDGSYHVGWTQRPLAERPLKEIGQFISSPTAPFRNSIILAANYRADDGLIYAQQAIKWGIAMYENGPTAHLT